jgi:hypothetical protein
MPEPSRARGDITPSMHASGDMTKIRELLALRIKPKQV